MTDWTKKKRKQDRKGEGVQLYSLKNSAQQGSNSYFWGTLQGTCLSCVSVKLAFAMHMVGEKTGVLCKQGESVAPECLLLPFLHSEKRRFNSFFPLM